MYGVTKYVHVKYNEIPDIIRVINREIERANWSAKTIDTIYLSGIEWEAFINYIATPDYDIGYEVKYKGVMIKLDRGYNGLQG